MLKVATIENPTQNIIAPSVYIDGVEKENGSYTVHYSLSDPNNSWITNEDILNNLSVYIKDDLNTQKRLLLASKTANVIKNNTIKDYFVFNNTGSYVSMSAWVGDQYISSSTTIEKILSNNEIVKANYSNTVYNFINKIKDLDLLNYAINLNSGSITAASLTPLESDLLVSYRPNKIASLGFVINLEKLLEQKSSLYNVLKNNLIYKQTILNNTKINSELSYFAKKNLTKKEKDYTKINNQVYSTILSINTSSYFVGIVDDNKDLQNKSYYDLKIKLEINDFSDQFIGNTVKSNISNALDLLLNYKNDFIQASSETNIQDANAYVFENAYEQKLPQITDFVNNLSTLCSLFFNIEAERYASLFVSLLHPLTTRIELLEKLTNFVNKLQSVVEQLSVPQLSSNNLTRENSKKTIIYERTFGKSENNIYAADFNYDYDSDTGIEILTSDNLLVRNAETPTAIKEINQSEIDARKILEATKYFGSPSNSTVNAINLFSVSSFDLKADSFQTLIALPQNSTDFYNDFYLKLKEYNEYTFSYRKPETYFFQLAAQGLNIKSISNRNNKSVNDLQRGTVFDSNSDTSQASLKFMSDTNIKNLYFALDNEKFISLQNISGSQQQRAALSGGLGESPVFAYSDQNLNNPDLKAKTFIYYNNFYSFTPIFGQNNSNLDVYQIQEKCVAEIFKNKLRLFNGFFGVRKTFSEATAPVLLLPIENDIKLNIPATYLSRKETPATINISTSDI